MYNQGKLIKKKLTYRPITVRMVMKLKDIACCVNDNTVISIEIGVQCLANILSPKQYSSVESFLSYEIETRVVFVDN